MSATAEQLTPVLAEAELPASVEEREQHARPRLFVERRATRRDAPLPKPAGRHLVVLIPAFNEQESIASVIQAIPRRFDGIALVEVGVINDGSKDETAKRAMAAGADFITSTPTNRGLAAAFNRGATVALGRGAHLVVTLDADGQHDPAAMASLIAPLVNGDADVAVVARPLKDASQGTLVRRFGNRFGSFVARRVMKVPLTDVTSGYRAFTRDALMQIHVTGGFTYTLETLVQAASKRLRMVEVIAPARKRMHGHSRVTRSIVSYVANTGGQALRTTIHSNPLRFFGQLAALCAAGSLLACVWFVSAYGNGGMHLPSLLAAVLLALLAVGLVTCGVLADAVCANRRLLEDTLSRLKQIEAAGRG
jgi:hypothetical protein